MHVSHIVEVCLNKRLVVIGCALPTPMACAYIRLSVRKLSNFRG